MSNKKYIVSADQYDSGLPKYLWFSKRYKVYPNLFVDTENWKKIVPEREAEMKHSRRKPKSFKKVARSVILSQRIGSGFNAKLKGATLKQCQLPSRAELSVANLMKWDVRRNVRIETYDVDNETAERSELLDPTTTIKADEIQKDNPNPVLESPYLNFLEAVSGEAVEVDRDQNSLLGGLQSWLGFAGSLGGAEMASMANVGVETSGTR